MVSNLFFGWEVSTFLWPVKSVGRQFYVVVFGQLLRDHPKHHLGFVNFSSVVFQFRKARPCSVTCKHVLEGGGNRAYEINSECFQKVLKIPETFEIYSFVVQPQLKSQGSSV